MESLLQNSILLFLLVGWSILWKGLALWQAAKSDQKYWFIVLLVVNTVGLLEIIYLVWFAKKKILWQRIFRR
jgi:predicted membrane protein